MFITFPSLNRLRLITEIQILYLRGKLHSSWKRKQGPRSINWKLCCLKTVSMPKSCQVNLKFITEILEIMILSAKAKTIWKNGQHMSKSKQRCSWKCLVIMKLSVVQRTQDIGTLPILKYLKWLNTNVHALAIQGML